MRRTGCLISLLVVICALPAGAQVGRNPHGDLPDGIDCIACHSAERWKPLRPQPAFDHGKDTGFALTGRHAVVGCAGCHSGLRFAKTAAQPRDCASCHTDVHQGRFGRDCGTCHDSRSFEGTSATRAHINTNFPLAGAHARVPCEGCHRDERAGRFTAIDPACITCHRADYQRSHPAGSFPITCTDCHTDPLTWRNASFRHDQFPLQGAHAGAPCGACHAGTDHHLIVPRPASSADCVACHRADYDRQHSGTAFPTTCLSCHTVVSWAGATFAHATFPLAGAHAMLPCTACHAPDNQLLFPKPAGQADCVACHRADYDRQHTGSGYPVTCTSCHASNTTWQGAIVDHTAISRGYTLLGAHIRATCSVCHAPPDGALRFSPPPRAPDECVACHRPLYDAKHGSSGYPTVCASCHNNDTWSGATIRHDVFPLLGAHTGLPCAACHAADNTLIFPRPANTDDCMACHRADYERQHTGSAFPTTCLTCHKTATWTGAVFDHAAVARGFVLEGIHAQVACTGCHAPDGRPLFSPAGHNDCVACHLGDFSTAHGNTGFPTTCTLCHQPVNWSSTFNHDAQEFPIYSGAHNGKWSVCQDCHTSQTNFAVFTCVTCHAKAQTDEHHKEVNGYAYDSARCYACHPRGNR